MAVTREEVAKLYVATFNRAPDKAGLDYWVNSSGLTIEQIAQSFFDQKETKALYPEGTTNAEFVTAIYHNLFNREPDPAGLEYWVDELDKGKVTRPVMIEAVKNGALDNDAVILANKTAVGLYVADTLGLNKTNFKLDSVTADTATVDAAKLSANDLAIAAGAQTYTITAAASSVKEGNTVDFTVKLGIAPSTDTTLYYEISGVAAAAGGKADPADDLGKVTGSVTIPAGSTTASFTLTAVNDGVTEGFEGFKVALLDSNFATVATSSNVVIMDGAEAGKILMLTKGVDSISPTSADVAFRSTSGNDTINALIDGTTGAVASTFTALDAIDGGDGTDELILNIINGNGDANTAVNALPTVTIANIETMTVRSAVGFGVAGVNDSADGNTSDDDGVKSQTIDFSTYTGLKTLNLTQSATTTSIKAANTTDINVSGATGAVEVVSGKNIVITDATTDQNITVGSYVTAANDDDNTAGDVAGTITITDTKQGSGVILVDGGTDVTITASSDKSSGGIVVGALKAATGTVTVTQNTNVTSDTAEAGDIAVTGGTTITVNVNSTNVASKGDQVGNVTAGTITITGGNTTTAVNVTQNHSATDFPNDASLGTPEVATVTFGSLKAGEKVAIGAGSSLTIDTDLTFTAAKDLTAAEVAAAFANLTNADIQASGGKVANGYFTGRLDAGWTSGAASGANVTFTATAVGNQTNEITVTAKKADGTTNTDNAADFKISKTDGTAAATSTAVDVTPATPGAVTINDNATASITDVTVNGYNTLAIGTTTALTKLANLSLANSAGTATVDAAAGITSLNLTVNNVHHAVDISTNSSGVATLNLTTAAKDSAFALTAADVKDLTVAGTNAVNLTGSTLDALEKVTVTGTAGLTLDNNVADTLTSVTTTGTTGRVTASIDGTKATYTGGAGVDNVSLVTEAALTKAIDLGKGDDTLTFVAAVTGSSAALNGGDGTDTLSMTADRADALDATAQTFYTNFERLTINTANTAASTINLANLGFTNYVTTSGTGGVTYTDDTAYVESDKVSVVINGTTVTASLPNSPNSSNITTAINTAADTVFGTTNVNYVSATLTDSDKKLTVISANPALYTVTAGTMTDSNGHSLNSTVTEAVLTLDKLAVNSTVVLTKDGAITAALADATGSSDVINVVANVATSDTDLGVFTVADVETVNLTATDTNVDEDGDGITYEAGDRDTVTLTLTADKATTVNLGSSNANLNLILTGSTKVALIDGTNMTGALTVTSQNTTTDVTIKGGSAGDSITAADTTTFANTIYGYDGNDTITAGKGLDKLYGGNGADTFYIAVASTNVNSAATIMDLGSGDVIKFGGADAFKSAAITLDTTAVFQDYANAAIASITTNNDLAWFQFGGNTYIVQEKNASTNGDVFVNNEDFIVKIAGLVDLSTASFNATSGTLEIA